MTAVEREPDEADRDEHGAEACEGSAEAVEAVGVVLGLFHCVSAR